LNNIHAHDSGEGEVVLLLHGFCEDGGIWENIEKEISQFKRVISPDLPGFGRSAPFSRPFSIEDMATYLINWLTESEVDMFIPIGHSLGGYIALAMVD